MTRVKICGLKDKAHALVAAEAGADFIGMVFAPCPRQVTVAQAYEIAQAVRKSRSAVQVVGVFVDTAPPVINQIADACLDWVQLSGNESWELCRQIKKPVIKAVRMGKEPKKLATIMATGEKMLDGLKHLYLLDSDVRGKFGGTGTTFDWSQARPLTGAFPVVIAGGLTPQNVAQAIKIAAPWGVDVSSGVETDGVKDVAKITAFIEAVRRADGRQST